MFLSRFFTVLRFELGKALRARFTWMVIFLSAAASVLTVMLDQATRTVRAAIDNGSEIVPSAYLGFAKGMTAGLVLGGVLLLLYASMIMANEGHWRTFKTIIPRPHHRWEWVAGKYALLLLLALVMITAVGCASFAAGAYFGDYGAIAEEGYEIYDAAFMRRSSWLAVELALLPLAALCAFGLMFSVMTDHSGIAASASLGAFIILETAKGSMPEGKYYLFNTFMPSLVDTSYFQALRGFADGLSDAGWEDGVMWYNMVSPLAAAVICFTVAVALFRRRDFLN